MNGFDSIPLYSCSGAVDPAGSGLPSTGHVLSASQARALAETRCVLLAASTLPRDEVNARRRLLQLCADSAFAAAALQENAPALPLAEAAARLWGNMNFGIREGSGEREAFAWDLETNVRAVRRFPVRHGADDTENHAPLLAALLEILPAPLMSEALFRCRHTLAVSGGAAAVSRVTALDNAPDGTPDNPSAPRPVDTTPPASGDGTSFSPAEDDGTSRAPDGTDTPVRTRPDDDSTPLPSGKQPRHAAREASRRGRRAGKKLAGVTGHEEKETSPTPPAVDDTTPDPRTGAASEGRETGTADRTDEESARTENRTEPARTEDAQAAPAACSENGQVGGEDGSHGEESAGNGRAGANASAPETASHPVLRYRPELILCPDRHREVDTLECHACPRHDGCAAYA